MQKPQGESVSGVHTESETTGKVITCKGECLSRDITESNWLIWWIIQENNSFFFFFSGAEAAVVLGPGQPFVIEEIQVDPPQKMEVRVKILYTSICHTDLSYWKGEVYMPSLHKNSQLSYNSLANLLTSMYLLLQSEAYRVYPRILGHEAAG